MKAFTVAAIAVLAAGTATPIATGANIMRVGNQGVTYAHVARSKQLGTRALQNVRSLRFELFGTAQVEDYEYDASYTKISRGLVPAAPEVTGSYIIRCTRRSPYASTSSSGSIRGPVPVIRRIPMSRPTQCTIDVTALAQTETAFPDEARVTIVRATVSTLK